MHIVQVRREPDRSSPAIQRIGDSSILWIDGPA